MTLSSPAPDDGTLIILSSNNNDLELQRKVKVQAGETTASFEFSIPKDEKSFPKGFTVEITANYGDNK